MTRALVDQDRQFVAMAIAAAMRDFPCCQPGDGWTPATVTESVTTSGCPLLTLTFPNGDAFNITITRARS